MNTLEVWYNFLRPKKFEMSEENQRQMRMTHVRTPAPFRSKHAAVPNGRGLPAGPTLSQAPAYLPEAAAFNMYPRSAEITT